MLSEAMYLPAWRIAVSVQCTWYGEYSERRTVPEMEAKKEQRHVEQLPLDQ